MIELKPGEALEPLDGEHYIIQSADGYRFGSDAIALAKFAAECVCAGDRVFDLCSGCGIVGIQLSLYTGCACDGAELDKTLWDMSVRSCEYNSLERIRFFNADVRNIASGGGGFARGGYDAVVCNPPFFKKQSKPRRVAPWASSELTVEFGDIARAAAFLLKPCGCFCMVFTSLRLDEALCVCRENGLTPKRLAFLSGGKTFLLMCVRGGKSGMTVSTEEF